MLRGFQRAFREIYSGGNFSHNKLCMVSIAVHIFWFQIEFNAAQARAEGPFGPTQSLECSQLTKCGRSKLDKTPPQA